MTVGGRRQPGGRWAAPRARAVLLGALLVAGPVACGGGDGADGAAEEAGGSPPATPTTEVAGEEDESGVPGEVEIVDFDFSPGEITVPVGTTVTWRNADEAIHSVADRALDVESEDLAQGGAFEHTYTEPGTFPYVCGIHNYMEGTVVVE